MCILFLILTGLTALPVDSWVFMKFLEVNRLLFIGLGAFVTDGDLE